MHDIAEFLRRHPPFDTLDEEMLASVAASAEIEFHAARAPVLDSAWATSEFAYVIRRGSVELLIGGRLLDLLGEGEMFGFASMLEEGPLGFVARAAEDTLVYRFPEHAIRPVLETPAAAGFIAHSMNKGVRLLAGQDEAPVAGLGRPVRDLVRADPLVCLPDVGVRDAARQMVEAGVTCVAVDLGETLGIVTDRDIRERVVAAGAPPETPLSAVMSAPAFTVPADASGAEALLEMLDHGIRHLPVLDPARRLVGVLDDVDLLASEHRTPFRLRALVARAADVPSVAEAAAELPAVVVALHEAGLPALAISRTISGIHDATTRRLVALAHEDLGAPPVPYTWLAMGSFGRREPVPSSDVDCAVAWQGRDDDEDEPAGTFRAVSERVLQGLGLSGFASDKNGAVASNPLFARSVDGWERAARSWTEDPDRDRGLMLLSVVVESDPVWGQTTVADRLFAAFAQSPDRRLMLARLLAAALAARPPTGFLRDFVLHSSGERRGLLDIKHGGLLPVESLARWAGLKAGVAAASTTARLDAAQTAGTLGTEEVDILRDAFELFCELRMEHQVEQLRAGDAPDDLIEPKRLAPLTRAALKDAFRGVRRVQRGLDVERSLSTY